MPEIEDATIKFVPVPTATIGGTPIKIKRGVIRKPPPTPNIPDKKPIAVPSPNRKNTLIDISAIGR
jgi:hypothetical protein